jgi:pimeloyl-ACP methyl ester carboxylesterase
MASPQSWGGAVLMSVAFTPAYATLQTSSWWQAVQLHRAPVVLVHGLWGSPAGWDDWLNADFGHSRVLDFSATNGASMRVSAAILGQQVEDFLEDLRSSSRIAVSRVDWVAHSLGGLLARQIYKDGNSIGSSRPWRRADNFGMGDIRKLITVTTPHEGAPLANALLSVDMSTALVRQLLSLVNEVGGAVRDLAIGSEALRSLGATDIPSHTIVGLGAESLVPNRASPTAFLEAAIAAYQGTADLELSGVFALLGILGYDPVSVYGGQPHDGIVQAMSQRGGVHSGACTFIHGASQPITHMTVRNLPEHQQVLDTVLQLLRTPVGSSSFAPLPAPSLVSPPTLVRTGIAPEALSILSPVIVSGGCLSVPGGSFSVSVAAPIGWVPTDVIVATPSLVSPMYWNGTEWRGPLPAHFMFDLNYFATIVAFNRVTGMVARSAPICVSVASPFAPLAIIAEPSSVNLSEPLQQQRIRFYADLGFMRVPVRGGLVVQSQNQDVADGTAEGYVRAKGTGTTILGFHWRVFGKSCGQMPASALRANDLAAPHDLRLAGWRRRSESALSASGWQGARRVAV